jgi:Mor family transcriptional regulator
MKYLEHLKIEELPEFYQMVIEEIGLDNTIKLARKVNGKPLYLMDPDRLLMPAKKAYIHANFTGNNHYKLAFDTGLSLAEVYKILAKPKDPSKQMSFLDND